MSQPTETYQIGLNQSALVSLSVHVELLLERNAANRVKHSVHPVKQAMQPAKGDLECLSVNIIRRAELVDVVHKSILSKLLALLDTR